MEEITPPRRYRSLEELDAPDAIDQDPPDRDDDGRIVHLDQLDRPERPRGRAVPPREESRLSYDIVVEGVKLGTVYPKELPAAAQFELEEAEKSIQLLDWLERYAGTDRERARRVLGAMPMQALVDMATEIATANGKAFSVPKARPRR